MTSGGRRAERPTRSDDGAGRWHWETLPDESASDQVRVVRRARGGRNGSTPGSEPAGSAAGGVAPLGHHPALDGLRAIAVAAVLVYHARFGWATGGFLGVSLFFTLSGFLITSLLLREGVRRDSVDLRGFWVRRFRRLLPASWATIGIVVAMGLVGVWNTDQLRDLRGDVPFALAEIINWHFIAQGRSYGAAFQAPSPLEHFWSLAVEQQFYVLLPLVIAGLLALERRRGGRSVRSVVAVCSVGLVASAALNGYLARSNLDAAYFSTFSRMFELLAGALLACALLRRIRLRAAWVRGIADALAVVGLAVSVVFWNVATVRSTWMYPVGFLVVAACTVGLILGALQGGLVTRVLAVRPLVELGRISYGVYLLHWPIFLWLTPERVGWSDGPLFALRMAVTLTASVLMFRFLEQPVRVGGLLPARRARVVAPAAVLVLLVTTGLVTMDLPAPTSLQQAAAATPTTAPPRPLTVTVIGDQFAASLDGHLAVGGRSPMDGTVVANAECGLAVGGWVRRADGAVERDVDRCAAARQGWIDQVAATRPDVVVVMAGTRDLADRRLSPTTPWAAPGSPEIDDFLRADVADLLGDLAATGTQVVVLSTPPVRSTAPDPAPVPTTLPADPTQAAMLVAEGQEAATGVPPAGHAENDDARRAAWNSVLRSAAISAGVTFLDADAEMATWPGGALDPRWRTEGIGLSPDGAARLSRWIAPRIRDLQTGIAAPAPLSALSTAGELPPAPPPTPRRTVPAGRAVDTLVVGDSVAHGIGYGLERWSKGRSDIEVLNGARLGCPIARGGSFRFRRDIATFAADCDWATVFPGLLQGQRPDVIVLATGIWEVVDRRFPGDDRWRHIGQPEVDAYILKELVSAIDVLGASGAKVVLLTYPHFQAGLDQGFTNLPESDPARVDRLNELLRQAAAARPGVATVVDLQGWYAQQPPDQDRVRRPDGLHFTDEFAPTIGGWLGPQLVALGRTPI